MAQLSGECNRCGQCCVIDGFACQYLEVTGKPGTPYASRCTVYTQRYQGMPLMLRKGIQIMLGHCVTDVEEEETNILARGIGHGCSLIRIDEVRS